MTRTDLMNRAESLMVHGFASDAARAEFDELLNRVELIDRAESRADPPTAESVPVAPARPLRGLTHIEQLEERISILEESKRFPAGGIVAAGSSYGPAALRRFLEHAGPAYVSDVDRQLRQAEEDAARRDRLDAWVRA